jgi:hypothetical protein
VGYQIVMGYETRLEGTLWIEPEAEDRDSLCNAIASVADLRAGRLSLTPLGRGLVFEDCFDWEAGLALLDRTRSEVLLPRAISLGGLLRAFGEDGAHLATVTVDEHGLHVVRHEAEELAQNSPVACRPRSDGPAAGLRVQRAARSRSSTGFEPSAPAKIRASPAVCKAKSRLRSS